MSKHLCLIAMLCLGFSATAEPIKKRVLIVGGERIEAQDSGHKRVVALPRVYSGNYKTKRIHKQSCRFFGCKSCLEFFYEDELPLAKERGYRGCWWCKPFKPKKE